MATFVSMVDNSLTSSMSATSQNLMDPVPQTIPVSTRWVDGKFVHYILSMTVSIVTYYTTINYGHIDLCTVAGE